MKDFFNLKQEEKFEVIGEKYFVAISKEHRFGTDSFLLVDFSNILRKDVVADFGTGCGIISILIYKKYTPKKIFAFDILKSATDLAKKSVLKSNLEEKIVVVNKDIKTLGSEYNDKFDKIVCNPPYKALNTGKVSLKKEDLIARHEVSLTIDDVCKKAYKMLKFGGSLFLSGRVERLADIFIAMRQNKLEPKKLKLCAKDKDSAPWLFLVEGKKGAKPFLNVSPNYFST